MKAPSVVAADINGQGVREFAAGYGDKIHPVQGDVSQKVDVDAMVRAATEAFGGIDIVVNNAGVTHRNQPLLEVGEAEFDRIYAVNVKSIYLSTIAAVPKMEKRGGGIIINIASTAGVRPRPGLTWYNGSKGAVITLTKSMAVELAPKNIRVNAINPVMGETGMLERFMGVARHAGEPRQVPRRHSARAGCRARTTSPMRRCSSPTRRRRSSPASPSRSTAAAASSASCRLLVGGDAGCCAVGALRAARRGAWRGCTAWCA